MSERTSENLSKRRYFPNSVSAGGSVGTVLFIFLLLLLMRLAGNQIVLPNSRVSATIALAVLGLSAVLILVIAWVPVIKTYVRGTTRRIFRSLLTGLAWPGRILSVPMSGLDAVLVSVFGIVAGATQPKLWARYMLLFAELSLCIAGSLLLDQPGAFVSLVIGFLLVFGLYRRWLWIEDDRDLFVLNPVELPHGVRGPFRIGFDQDLTDEALTALVSMFVLVPCALLQFHQAFGGFENAEGAQWADWTAFMAGELVKAVPFVDWSEVYGVRNGSAIEPNSAVGQHAVFVMRALFDLLLIAGVLQGLAVSQRMARQRRRLDDDEIDLVDPFLERQLLAASADYTVDLDEYFYTPPRYRVTRLLAVLKNNSNLVLVRAGAARWLGTYHEDATSVPLLSDVTLDENDDEFVRASAVQSLLFFPGEGGTKVLISVLKTPSWYVTVNAIRVLGWRRDPSALVPIVRVLEDKGDRTYDEYERSVAARALGHLGVEDAIPPLMSVLRDESEPTTVRVAAAAALGNLRALQAVDLLKSIAATAKEKELRDAAVLAVREIEMPKGDRLHQLKSTRSRRVLARTDTLSALKSAGADARDVRSCAENDPSPFVRRFARNILFEMRAG